MYTYKLKNHLFLIASLIARGKIQKAKKQRLNTKERQGQVNRKKIPDIYICKASLNSDRQTSFHFNIRIKEFLKEGSKDNFLCSL